MTHSALNYISGLVASKRAAKMDFFSGMKSFIFTKPIKKSQINKLVSCLNILRPCLTVTTNIFSIRANKVVKPMLHSELPVTNTREFWKMQKTILHRQPKLKLKIK